MSAPTVPVGSRGVSTTAATRVTTPAGSGARVAAPVAAGRRVTATARDAMAFLAAGVAGGTAAGLVTWWVMSNVTIPIHI